MAVLAGAAGALFKQDGASIAITNEACTDAGDHRRYQVTDAAHRYLDPTLPVVVQKSTDSGSTWTTVKPENIECPGGYIVLAAAGSAGDLIRLASASYFNLAEWGGVLDWKMDTDREMIDCTSFSTTGNGYKNYFPALGEHSVSANAYWQNDANNSLIGTLLVFQLFVDYVNKCRYECYGYLGKDSITTAAKDLVKESIDFKVAQAYYREG